MTPLDEECARLVAAQKYDQLIRLATPAVLRYVRVYHWVERDELIAAIHVGIWAAAQKFDGSKSFIAYAARYGVRTELRSRGFTRASGPVTLPQWRTATAAKNKEARRVLDYSDEAVPSLPARESTDSAWRCVEVLRAVDRALESIPDPERRRAMTRHILGLDGTAKAIGAQFGVTRAAVTGQLKRLRQAIAGELARA